jgi:hypothetical protein
VVVLITLPGGIKIVALGVKSKDISTKSDGTKASRSKATYSRGLLLVAG